MAIHRSAIEVLTGTQNIELQIAALKANAAKSCKHCYGLGVLGYRLHGKAREALACTCAVGNLIERAKKEKRDGIQPASGPE